MGTDKCYKKIESKKVTEKADKKPEKLVVLTMEELHEIYENAPAYRC